MKIEYAGLNLKLLLCKKSLCLLLVVILSGCAAADIGKREFQTSTMDDMIVTDTQSDIGVSLSYDGERIKLERIGVQEIDGGKKVVILGSKPISYTAFKLNDPSRLIIDIPNIDFGELREPLNVESNVIKTINTHIFGGDTENIGRIEIEMMAGVEYELDQLGSAIYAKFVKEENRDISVLNAPVLPETVNVAENYYEASPLNSTQIFTELGVDENDKKGAIVETKKEAMEETAENKLLEKLMFANEDTSIQKTAKEVKELKVAEKLLSIDVNQGENITEVLLKADGTIKSFDSFRMSNTERIVIDLWGIRNSLSTSVMPLETPYADRIRTGKHSDKTRVVIDLKSPEFSYSLEQVADGLLLALSQKGTTDKIKTAALPNNAPTISKIDKLDSPDEEKSGVQITDVNFEDNENTSKVLITALDKVEYDFSKSYDGKTLALIIKDAFLPDKLQRTLDTSMLKSPAQRVSSFMSKGKTDNKTMIVVRLKEKVPYEIAQEDNLLTLSFPKQKSEKLQDGNKVLTVATDVEVESVTAEQKNVLTSSLAPNVDETMTGEPQVLAEVMSDPTDKEREIATTENESQKIAAKPSSALKFNELGQGRKAAQELKKVAVVTPATVEKKVTAINKPKVIKGKVVSAKLQENLAFSKPENLENEAVKKPKKLTKTVAKKVSKEKKYIGRKISLDFKDADIKNILRLIAEVSNLNIVAGDDVKGKVTLRLLNVPWDQALELVLKSKSLGMIKEGSVIRIAPMTKIAAEKKMILDDKKSEEKLENLEVKIVPVNYSSANGLTAQVKNLLSDRGSVTVDSRTNVLIIRDIQVNIDEAEALVQMLDTPTPQVLIEARIVEAQRNFAKDLGVEWGFSGASGENFFGSILGNSSTAPSNTLLPTGMVGSGAQFSSQPNFAVSLPASGTAGSLGSVGFSFGKLNGDPWLIDLRLSAGEVAGLSKTISRPRVITLDNIEAKISQGDSVPFETISDGGTNTEFIDATLDLTVTPHITADGSVFMKIKVSRNSIGTFRSASGTPSISKKEASTEIMIKDGETAVIGGIVVSDESDSNSGVPYLKKVPVLGWLFKRNSIADSQTELLIFITPKVMKDSKSG